MKHGMQTCGTESDDSVEVRMRSDEAETVSVMSDTVTSIRCVFPCGALLVSFRTIGLRI